MADNNDGVEFRLAFRHEGTLWNAYVAEVGTMKDAVLMGSIAFGAAEHSPALKAAFMNLMRKVMEEYTAAVFGAALDWESPRPAPEHERGGHA